MKISTITGQNKNSSRLRKPSAGTEGAKVKKTFSSSLDTADRDHTQKELMEMVEKIKAAGNKLKSAATEQHIKEYKGLVKEYLTYVLRNFHKLRHDRSVNYSTVYTRVEIINQEVEELTQRLLAQEKGNIDIVAEVDKIAGLIIDVFS